MEVFRKLGVVT